MIEYAEDVFKPSEIGQTEKKPLWNYAVEIWAAEYITFGSYLFAEWIVQKWLHILHCWFKSTVLLQIPK